jgi:hypothetical protein
VSRSTICDSTISQVFTLNTAIPTILEVFSIIATICSRTPYPALRMVAVSVIFLAAVVLALLVVSGFFALVLSFTFVACIELN